MTTKAPGQSRPGWGKRYTGRYKVSMCGRYSDRLSWRELHDLYELTGTALNLRPRYNVCPTDEVFAVVERDSARRLILMRWGLVPAWWKKSARETPATFNARAETVAEKPMFRGAYRRNRCLIPASGYYEWEDVVENGNPVKQPHFFTRRDGAPVTIAAIWDEWRETETGERVQSCAMIITAANAFVGEVHYRMPVILEQHEFGPWLRCELGDELLRPAANDVLQRWPVSRRVNSSRADTDDASLAHRIELPAAL